MTLLLFSTLFPNLYEQNPEVMNRLQKEIRGALGDHSENATVVAVSKLEYLDAVLREAMRSHAPVPTANPLVVGGSAGAADQRCASSLKEHEWGIPQKTAYRPPCNFVEPLSVLPERWLPDPKRSFCSRRQRRL